MDLYQVCSNYAPWARNGPAPVVTCFTQAYIGTKHGTNFLSKTMKPRALIFGYVASPSGPLPSLAENIFGNFFAFMKTGKTKVKLTRLKLGHQGHGQVPLSGLQLKSM